jgi:uncharacterized protein YigE (DUF2233 family)
MQLERKWRWGSRGIGFHLVKNVFNFLIYLAVFFYTNIMNSRKITFFLIIILLATIGYFLFKQKENVNFISYTVDLQKKDLKLYYKDDKGVNFKSLGALKTWLQRNNKTLHFAMNGGMYKQDNSPQGLFIENGLQINPLDTSNGNGNFYLKPNGFFYITKNRKAGITQTDKVVGLDTLLYATQSGPMLIIDGNIHAAFKEGSPNVNIRNGVGILPDNTIIFVLSKNEINFYDFANYFKKLGCKNALYLDGLVSRAYLPSEDWRQLDGNFGVIIGVEK